MQHLRANTVCCAAAWAVLDGIENEWLIERLSKVGADPKQGFERLKETYLAIGGVRRASFYVDVDWSILTVGKHRIP